MVEILLGVAVTVVVLLVIALGTFWSVVLAEKLWNATPRWHFWLYIASVSVGLVVAGTVWFVSHMPPVR